MAVHVHGSLVPRLQSTLNYNSPCAKIRSRVHHVGLNLPLLSFHVEALNAGQNREIVIGLREAADTEHL